MYKVYNNVSVEVIFPLTCGTRSGRVIWGSTNAQQTIFRYLLIARVIIINVLCELLRKIVENM